MNLEWYWILIIVLLCLIVGVVAGFLVSAIMPKYKEKKASHSADKIINEAQIKAEHITKNAELDAKQTIFEMKQEAEKDIKERKQDVVVQENKLLQREQSIDQRDNSLIQKENNLEEKSKQIDLSIEDNKKKGVILQEKIDGILVELEKVGKMSTDEAKTEIFKRVEEKYQKEITQYMKNREDEAESEADEKAKMILANAMFRDAQEVTTDRTVNVISIPSDEMKGRIIGREGRNIKSLEQLLGVDIIIDDTPEAITVSCFNPIRREVASRALGILVKDGRIQPGRIEEVVAKCQKDVDEIVRKAGQDAVFKLGLGRMDKELMNYVGKLRFRTSYGQNQLEHSIETAELCGMMAAELGLDQTMAKRAGLLHDIGKAADFEVDGSHVEIGARLAKKYGEPDVVINSIESHHGDVPPKYITSVLVAAADTLSAARPGARSETLETYIKRIEQLETICKGFDGVQQCYAMQSGREVRVMVIPDKVDDLQAFKMAHDIKEKIENEMTFPGQIKVNVIREYRAIETAK
ncbi:MAG: ribonuclease Y [Bacilli bacterium]|jgi:ribonucrease Y